MVNSKGKRNYYTVYNRKNETIVAFGTADECAKQMHRSLSSFYCTVSRNRKGLHKKYDVIVDCANDIEE